MTKYIYFIVYILKILFVQRCEAASSHFTAIFSLWYFWVIIIGGAVSFICIYALVICIKIKLMKRKLKKKRQVTNDTRNYPTYRNPLQFNYKSNKVGPDGPVAPPPYADLQTPGMNSGHDAIPLANAHGASGDTNKEQLPPSYRELYGSNVWSSNSG